MKVIDSIFFISSLLVSLLAMEDFHDAHFEASVYLADNSSNLGNPPVLEIKMVYDTESIAYAKYSERLMSTGWDFLTLSSYTKNDGKYSDSLKAYAFGYLEGYLTSKRISTHFQNTKQYYFKTENIPENLKQFIDENRNWILKQTNENPNDDFWYQVSLTQMQLEGMIDGYNSISTNKLSYAEFSVVNASNEIGEISKYYKKSFITNFESLTFSEMENFINRSNHCSVLVKVAADFSDVYFGHNTWLNYSSMTRIFKEYRFVTERQKSYATVFSSYPGNISSNDDFFITDQNLYISETTNSIFDESLYNILTPESVMTWQRAVVANRLSQNSYDWIENITKHNSGTLNNQWQIFDMKKFDGRISEGALTIVEQIPGYSQSEDVTEKLKFGYWPSYNIPYFEKVRTLAGYDEIGKKKPELKEAVQYWTCPRANIFRRDQSKVIDINSMKGLMRFNDFTQDALSKGSPKNALACRADLDPSNPSCSGATDAKLSSWKKANGKAKSVFIIAGPTTDQQTPFNTKISKCLKGKSADQYTFYGLPETFNFKWIEYKTTLF